MGNRERPQYRDSRGGVVRACTFLWRGVAYVGQNQDLKDPQDASERWLRAFFERNRRVYSAASHQMLMPIIESVRIAMPIILARGPLRYAPILDDF